MNCVIDTSCLKGRLFFDEIYLLRNRILILIGIFVGGVCFAGNAKVDIEFKGKKSLHYSDVCLGKGEVYTDLLFNFGQFVCKPNFKEYGGVPLIAEMKDGCDSKVEYDPLTGKLIDFDISYAESSFYEVMNVLSEKYGKPEDESKNAYVDTKKNLMYRWEDSKGGWIFLTMNSVHYFKKGHISPTVVRYCTVLSIRTREMQNLRDAMERKSDDIRKSKIKNNANKL